MKNIIFIFFFTIFLASNVSACPYQKMAEVNSKLIESQDINSKTLNEITILKQKSENKMKIGELESAEEILDRALALFVSN